MGDFIIGNCKYSGQPHIIIIIEERLMVLFLNLYISFSPPSSPYSSFGFLLLAIDTVPRLKEVFARVLPVLASIKLENMKWVFASGKRYISIYNQSLLHISVSTLLHSYSSSRVLWYLFLVLHYHPLHIIIIAIGHFCDAVIHYVANIDKGSNKTLTTSSFSSEVFPAYEIMFNNWLISKETKVQKGMITQPSR